MHSKIAVYSSFIDKYMELEKSETEKVQIFQAVEDALKSEGIVLQTLEVCLKNVAYVHIRVM